MRKTIILSAKTIILVMALFLVTFAAMPTSVTVTLNSVADSYMSETAGNNNYGTLTTMNVRSTITGDPDRNQRSFARFDISTIPPGSTIQTAFMRLYMVTAPGRSRNYDADRATASWVETTITWNNQPATAGSPITIATGTTSNVWLSWNVMSDVAGFYAGTYSNYGWRIKDQIENSAQNRLGIFDTRESGTSFAPELEVTYVLPTFTLTYTAGAHGSISGVSPQTVDYGDDGTSVTAVPDSGYVFFNWSDGITDNPRTDTYVTGDITVTASFYVPPTPTPILTPTPTPAPVTVTLNSVADSYVSDNAINTNYGTITTMNVRSRNTPMNQRSFVQFVISSIPPGSTIQSAYLRLYLATAPGATRNYDADRVTAAWIESGVGGITWTIQPATAGAPITIATGILPGVWLSWGVTSDVAGFYAGTYSNFGWRIKDQTENSATNRLGIFNTRESGTTNDPELVVTYLPPSFTLTYTAGAHGSISGVTPQTVDYGLNGTQVTAVPDVGYHFVNWSDGVLTAARTDTSVTGNISVTANFAINTYTLTYIAGAHGSITGTSPQTVNYNADGSAVTPEPATGYHFVNWSDAITANPRTDTNVHTNINVTASFAINQYTLTYTAGANGTTSGTATQIVDYGADGSAVTADPDPGYHFTNWSDASTANPRTDTSVTADITVTANFAINTYTLTYTPGAHGSISGISPQMVDYGADGSAVTADPDLGYHFVNWSDASIDNPRTDTSVAASINVTANFAINTYTLTYTAGAHGAISGLSPQTVNYGADGSAVTALPATAGYHFVNWSDTSTANPRTDTGVTVNITVTANFAINTYTLTYTAGAHGSITGTSPQTVNYGGSGTPVEAIPDTGYHFVDWSDASTANPRTDINVTADITVTANFAINVTYTLTVNATNGSVAKSPDLAEYDYDATVNLTAIPDPGYRFTGWSGDFPPGHEMDNPLALTMDGNKTLTANFAIKVYTVTFQTDGTAGATFTGTTTQMVNHGADCTAVKANAPTNYRFVKWTKGGVNYSTANPLTVTNVTEDMTLKAIFASTKPSAAKNWHLYE